MATLPMSQPQNPNQAAGASLSPMQYSAPATQFQSFALQGPTGQTGVGASTAGQPFGTVPYNPLGINTNQPSISSGIDTTDGEKTLMGDFKDTYGAGTGSALLKQLGSLGTSTNQAYQATAANVLGTANDQYANMLATEAARGVSPDSSSHALAAGDFAAKVNANLADLSGQMQLGGLQTIISSLTGEGQQHGPDTGFWDTFAQVMDTGASIAGDFVGAAIGTGGFGMSKAKDAASVKGIEDSGLTDALSNLDFNF